VTTKWARVRFCLCYTYFLAKVKWQVLFQSNGCNYQYHFWYYKNTVHYFKIFGFSPCHITRNYLAICVNPLQIWLQKHFFYCNNTYLNYNDTNQLLFCSFFSFFNSASYSLYFCHHFGYFLIYIFSQLKKDFCFN
jgi:hypothetical protein